MAAAVAHLPLLSLHAGHLWDRPHYRFAPVLTGVVAWLLWTRWPRGEEAAYVRGSLLEKLLLAGSLLLLAAAVGLFSPLLACASAVLCLGFFIVYRGGLQAVPRLFAPWALLWLTIPPPLGYDLWLISKMQGLTSGLSSWLLDAAAVDHWMAGNVLHVADATFFVDEACSGIHSLFALFGYTAVFAVITSRGVRRSLLLLASTLVWATLLNVLRVTIIALGHIWWGLDLATGWAHEALGFSTFVLALALTLSTDQALQAAGYVVSTALALLRWFTTGDPHYVYRKQRPAEPGPSPDAPAEVTPPKRPSLLTGQVAAAAYTLLLITGVGSLWADESLRSQPALAEDLQQSLMPRELTGFRQVNFEQVERDLSSDLGERSTVWRYVSGRLEAAVSVDRPFPGWHELCRCYEGQGWTLEERTIGRSGDGAVPGNRVEATFSRASGEHAFLVFCLVDRTGAAITPPGDRSVKRFLDRLRSQETVQIQTFVVADSPLTDAEAQQVRDAFGLACDRVRGALH